MCLALEKQAGHAYRRYAYKKTMHARANVCKNHKRHTEVFDRLNFRFSYVHNHRRMEIFRYTLLLHDRIHAVWCSGNPLVGDRFQIIHPGIFRHLRWFVFSAKRYIATTCIAEKNALRKFYLRFWFAGKVFLIKINLTTCSFFLSKRLYFELFSFFSDFKAPKDKTNLRKHEPKSCLKSVNQLKRARSCSAAKFLRTKAFFNFIA